MTIINPHNVRQLYFTWLALLLVSVGLALGSYYLARSAFVPVLQQAVPAAVYSLVGYAVVAFGFALVFKYSLRRQAMAWGFFTSIAVVAGLLTLLVDSNIISLILHVIGTISLLCFGPYLYFE